MTQLSQPSGSSYKAQEKEHRKSSLTENMSRNPRFTTTIVNEAEHAASMGLAVPPTMQKPKNSQIGVVSDTEGHASFFVGDTPLGNKDNTGRSDNTAESSQRDSEKKSAARDPKVEKRDE